MANSKTGWVDSRAPWLLKSSRPDRLPSWKMSTSTPKAALSVSAFMTTAFSGSRSDPVIKKSSRTVAVMTMAIAIGRCDARLACRSMKAALDPPTSSWIGL